MDPEDDSTIQLDADLPLDTPRTKQRNFGGGGGGVEDGEESLSPLETEVLEEYARLVGNLDDVGDRREPSPLILSLICEGWICEGEAS